jgi:hypothetical protein
MKSRLFMKTKHIAIAIVLSCLASAAHATNYYVDSVSGNDTRVGTSQATAWKTTTKVQNALLNPGDVVYFKRGSVFTNGMSISRSGTASQPITFLPYGTGNNPVFKKGNKTSDWAHAIDIFGDYLIFESLLASDAHETGFALNYGADNNTIRYCSATKVGSGILVRGNGNFIFNNWIYDTTMIVNDTTNPDNDYGANGVFLEGAYNTIEKNTFTGCKAPSFDYGFDGGAIEFWGGSGSSNHHNRVLRNKAENCAGFIEMGSSGGTITDITIAYNVAANNGLFLFAHVGGGSGFPTNYDRIVYENNTAVELPSSQKRAVIGFSSNPSTYDKFVFRNNIFYVGNYQYVCDPNTGNWTHYNNTFYRQFSSTTSLGFTINANNNALTSDPLFVNLGGGDYRLQAGSPAINKGTNIGYTLDFAYQAVPIGGIADMGAYERQ